MIETTFNFESVDGMNIFVYKWMPEADIKPRAVIQLVHGSVEHAYRYKDFAEYLVSQGFVVYADDHRGHGKTAGTIDDLSYFSDLDNGYDIAIDDLYRLNEIIKKEYRSLKIFMLGHSLGSFMLRKYATLYPKSLQGMILTGTGGGQNMLLNFGLFMACQNLKKKGRRFNSKKLHKLMFGPLNDNIKNKKSEVDFISRDQNIIDAYNADPYCGHTITTEYAFESLKGIKFCSKKSSYSLVPKSLPIFILSGSEDLVGGKGSKEVIKVFNQYKKHGIKDLEYKIYSGYRHEILNEIDKELVYHDINDWINKRVNS